MKSCRLFMVRAGAVLVACLTISFASAETVGTALVRHAPAINSGTVDGSIQQMLGESLTLNGGAVVTGNLLVPGTPTVRLNGKPHYDGTLDGAGAISPSNYQVTLNGNVRLGHVTRRTDPIALPTVAAPAQPAGTRSVVIDAVSQSAGNFATLRHLTLNGNVGQFAVPPGSYGNFTANGGSGFTLGVPGSAQPTVYNFQRLVLNGQTEIRLVGPVIINLANGIAANGTLGSSVEPRWLAINVYSGGFILNGSCTVHGYIHAPSGTVIVNGNSQLVGGVVSDRLVVNGGGLLRLRIAAPFNQSPIADQTSASTDEDTARTITLTGSDADGHPLTYAIVTPPAHGALTPSLSPSTFTFTPARDYHGPDSFTFKVNDGTVDSAPATVSLTIVPINDPPIADAKTIPVIAEDTSAMIVLSGSDVESSALTFNITVPPQHGTLSGTGDGLTYTPAADYFGPDQFSYVAHDGTSASTAAAVVSLSVSPVNDPPVATALAKQGRENTPLPVQLQGTDKEGSPLTYTILSQPASGTLTGTAPNLVYRSVANYSGVDSFSYKVNDGALDSAPASVTVAIDNPNDPPTAVPQAIVATEDTPKTVMLSGVDPDGGPLAFEIVTPPTRGTLSGAGATRVYSPQVNFTGADSFTFRVSDGLFQSSPATVSIVVDPVNDAPVSIAQMLQAAEDTPLAITLTGTDVENGTLTFAVVAGPTHGTLSGTGSSRIYTPAANFSGTDSLTFRVNDGEADSAIATVGLTVTAVNDAPTVSGQTLTTVEDAAVTVTLGGADVEGSALTFTIVSPPQHGTCTQNGATLVYTPGANFHGTDTFTFSASDGELSAEIPANVVVTTTPQNDLPVASNQTLNVSENAPSTLTLGATDVDGDTLTFIFSQPANGTLAGIAPNLTYTPAPHFVGTDSFTFQARDPANASSNTAVVTLIVYDVNTPPTATNQAFELDEDTPRIVALNVVDADNDALAYTLVTPPANGSLANFPSAVTSVAPTITYTPAADFNGADSFTYEVRDGGATAVWATVSFSVRAVNDAPVADSQAIAITEDTPRAIALMGSDAEGATLAYTIVSMPTKGSLSGTAPNLVYTPSLNFFGSDSFTFKANDGASDSATATIAITVTPANDAPVAAAASTTVLEDTPKTLVLSATDADGDTLAVTVTRQPDHGSLSGTAPHLVYTPATNYNGSDTIKFKARDADAESNEATVTITVTPLNDPPVAAEQSLAVANDRTLSITLVAADVDGDALTFDVVQPPASGVLTGTGATRTYTPVAGFVGSAQFTYKANDGTSDSNLAQVTVEVREANDAPVVSAGLDRQIQFTSSSSGRPRGRIVVNHDEWTLTDTGFTQSPFAAAFARNVADFLSGGLPNAKFLAYARTVPGSVEFVYTGSSLAAIMRSAGHSWDVFYGPTLTLEVLLHYDAVFLSANDVDNQVLIDYVNAGGSVHLSAGTKWCGCDAQVEAGWWGSFLREFGLEYLAPYNGVRGTLPVVSSHPLLAGVQSLYFSNGNSIRQLNPEDPFTAIILSHDGHGLLASYDGGSNHVLLHGEATDDARPSGILNVQWTQVSGPPATIEAPTSLTTRVRVSTAGVYRFRLTGSDGQLTSFDDVVVHANTPPQVFAGPDRSVRAAGESLALDGRVQDPDLVLQTPVVQWRMVSGPGNATFASPASAMTSVSFDVTGLYVLELSANDGLQSARDLMEVRVGTVHALSFDPTLRAWWPGNDHRFDVVSGRGAIVAGADYGSGKVSSAFRFDGLDDHLFVPRHEDINLGVQAQGFTLEFWAKPDEARDAGLISWRDSATTGISIRMQNGGRGFYGFLRDTNGQTKVVGADDQFQPGVWHHVAITFDRPSGLARAYMNGVIIDQKQFTESVMLTAPDVYFGADSGLSGFFKGALDEIAFYARALSPGEVFALFAAGADGRPPIGENGAPAVSAGPDIVVPSSVGAASLVGTAVDQDGGPLPLSVAWSKLSGPGEVVFANSKAAATSATFGASGVYLLQLQADDGLLKSSPDTVVVYVGVRYAEPLPPGMAAWWPVNSSSAEVVRGNHDLELFNGLAYAPGNIASALAFDGANDFGRATAHEHLDIGNSPAGFSIELWVKPEEFRDAAFVHWGGGTGNGLSLRATNGGRGIYAFIYTASGQAQVVGADNQLELGVWQHIGVSYDRITRIARVYKNGVVLAERDVGLINAQTTYDLYIGRNADGPAYFKGLLDEIALYTRPLLPTEMMALFRAGTVGKAPVGVAGPSVNAGSDTIVPNPAGSADLGGMVTGSAGAALSVGWSKRDGPGDVTFANPNAAQTAATFSAPGIYLLQLDADDGLFRVVDTVVVRVGVRYAGDTPADLAAWWPANGVPHEVVRGNHDAQLLNGASYSAGLASLGFVLETPTAHAVVPAHADLDVGTSARGFSVELWVKPQEFSDTPVVQWSTGPTDGVSLRTWNSGRGLYAFIVDSNGQLRLAGRENEMALGVWQHLAMTYDRATGVARVYRNGVLRAENNIGSFAARTAQDVYFGALPRENRFFKGSLDEPSFYSRSLSEAEVREIYEMGMLGKCPVDDNAAPFVNAGPDRVLDASLGPIVLHGTVTDDGGPAPLVESWTKLDGPGAVEFTNPSAGQINAAFSTPGLYVLQISADDGLNLAKPDTALVRVSTPGVVTDAMDMAAWWPGNGDTEEVIRGRDARLTGDVTFESARVSMGYRFGGAAGAAHVPAHADLDIGASEAGFTIELWIKPDEFRDTPIIQWTSGSTDGVSLRIWNSGRGLHAFIVDANGQLRIAGADQQMEIGTWQHVAFTYDRATGVGRVYRNGAIIASPVLGVFTARTTTDLVFGSLARENRWFKGMLDEVSLYRRPLSPAEIGAIYNAGAGGKLIPAINTAPVVKVGSDQTTAVNVPLPIAGTATDDGLPNPPAALTYEWSKVSGPGSVVFSAPASASTTATFDAAGSYRLRFSASDTLLSNVADVNVIATQPPVIAFLEPENGSKIPAAVTFELLVRATDIDGSIAKVEFFQGATKLSEQTAPIIGDPNAYFCSINGGLPVGSYVFTAKATDDKGVSTTTPPLELSVVTDPGPPLVEITTPAEDVRITQPIPITGIAASPVLSTWKLERRLKVADGEPTAAWITFANGTTSVGAEGAPSALGTFDPTLLLNGIYELRLVVRDAADRTVIAGPITVVVEGNMKTGAFSLAFEDMKVPVAGIPITITRTYDSRDPRVGDFGPGWRLALNNIRVQKNRHLGTGWWQTPQAGSGIQFYDVLPLVDRIVTIVMPDGETHRFKAGALVKNRIGDPDHSSFAVVVTKGKYRFYPIGDTSSKLEPLDSSNQLAEDFWIDGTGNQDLRADDPDADPFATNYNTTRYRLTTSDGTVFILDEALGLLEMRDLNGNTLVLDRDPQSRVSGVTAIQNAPGGPIARSVTIVRDATGRIDYIRDPAGRDLDYLYDPQGRLASFTNRESNVTQFRYEVSSVASHPQFHYLTRVIDPRGVSALRSEYDSSTGKLVKQIDADGKETVFNRGVDTTGRFEKVKDRLGHETTFYYDERGNVTLKIDPLGAQTSYSYWPDSDRVKFETDHYGNVKSMAYDAQGNVTVQTLGASTSEDPANPTTGYTTRTTYNARSAPTQITDPDGRVQAFAYNAATNNLLTHTIGAGGGAPATTSYTYNSDGTLDTVTDALGNVTSHTYNYAFSDPAYPGAVKQTTVTVTDPAGAAGSDPANGAVTVLRATRTLFDAQENQLAQIVARTLPDGASEDVVTRYIFDAENRITATILPDGRVTETRYTSFGKEDKTLLWKSLADYQTRHDSGARITSYGYDARGNQISVTQADGTTEAMSFDLENRKTWSQDRRGYRTFFIYDAVGRLRFTLQPDANDGVGAAAPTALTDSRLGDNPRTETRYDLIGRVRFQIDERGATTEFTYEDNCGCASRRKQMIQHRSVGNLVTTYAYDQAGNVRFVTDPRGNTVETRYDDHGRPTQIVYPATDEHPSTQTETHYDVLGRRTAMIDQEGKITRYRYDALGRLVEVRQYLDQSLAAGDASFQLPSGGAGIASTRYTYDALGNQQTQTDTLGRVTTFWTDQLGRRTKRILPEDGGASSPPAFVESLTYDEWGNLWKRTDFAGKTTTFGYDTLNRLESKLADPTHPSLSYGHAIARIEYDYDANGARTAARTFSAGNTPLYAETTPRDERGRIDFKDTAGGRLDYRYHANSRLKDVVSSNPGGANVGYRYDEVNRLEAVDDTSTGLPTRTTGYTYNPNGSLETVAQPNGVVHTFGYDALNRLRTLIVSHGSTFLHTYEYKLRAGGHRREVVEGTRVTTYDYDGLYRLTGEAIAGDPNGHDGSVGYTLDKVGNRLSRVSQLSALNSQVNQTYNARDWLNGDTYSPNGSTLSSSQLSALDSRFAGTDTYDFEERLIVRTRPDGSTVNVSYDADGHRIAKTLLTSTAQIESSTQWLVDTNNLTGYAQVFEERVATPAGTTLRTYTYGTSLISQATSLNGQPPTLTYFASDGHGNIRELTTPSGTVTDRYTYDAFGNLTHQSGSTANMYRYAGEQYDPDLGLYYNRARYLNTDSGRFWSLDTYEGVWGDPRSQHKYLYAHANPVMYADPSGHMTLAQATLAVGTIGILSGIALPQVRTAYSNAATALWQAGVGVASSVKDAVLAPGGTLALRWEEEREKTKARVETDVLSRSRFSRILYHYSDAGSIAAIAASGIMLASDTFSSVMHKGAYATDVEPWSLTLTKRELSFGFYGHENADVSWFVMIDAPDFYSIGAPYDARVSHWVRAVSLPGEPVPVRVLTSGPNPMP